MILIAKFGFVWFGHWICSRDKVLIFLWSLIVESKIKYTLESLYISCFHLLILLKLPCYWMVSLGLDAYMMGIRNTCILSFYMTLLFYLWFVFLAVPISVIASFRKLKRLTRNHAWIVAALRESSLLVSCFFPCNKND